MHIRLNNIEIAKFAFDLIETNYLASDIEKLGVIKLFETIWIELFPYTFHYYEVDLIAEINKNLDSKKSLQKHRFSKFMINNIYHVCVDKYYSLFDGLLNYLLKEISKFNISYDELLVLKMFLMEMDERNIILYRNIHKNEYSINLVVESNPDDVLLAINQAKYFKHFFSVISIAEFREIEKILSDSIQKIYLN